MSSILGLLHKLPEEVRMAIYGFWLESYEERDLRHPGTHPSSWECHRWKPPSVSYRLAEDMIRILDRPLCKHGLEVVYYNLNAVNHRVARCTDDHWTDDRWALSILSDFCTIYVQLNERRRPEVHCECVDPAHADSLSRLVLQRLRSLKMCNVGDMITQYHIRWLEILASEHFQPDQLYKKSTTGESATNHVVIPELDVEISLQRKPRSRREGFATCHHSYRITCAGQNGNLPIELIIAKGPRVPFETNGASFLRHLYIISRIWHVVLVNTLSSSKLSPAVLHRIAKDFKAASTISTATILADFTHNACVLIRPLLRNGRYAMVVIIVAIYLHVTDKPILDYLDVSYDFTIGASATAALFLLMALSEQILSYVALRTAR